MYYLVDDYTTLPNRQIRDYRLLCLEVFLAITPNYLIASRNWVQPPPQTPGIILHKSTSKMGSMYNPHRGIGPAPGPQSSRLNELLDGVRAEFETQARASGEYEHSSTPGQYHLFSSCHLLIHNPNSRTADCRDADGA